MTTVYKTPDEVDTLTIRDDLEAVLSRHERFKPIVDFELKIDILLAYSDKDDAVKLHGIRHSPRSRLSDQRIEPAAMATCEL